MLIQEGIKYTQKLYGVEIKKIASNKAVYFAFSLNPDSTMEQRKELSNTWMKVNDLTGESLTNLEI